MSAPDASNGQKSESILRFENVSVDFYGVRALHDVSFDLRSGETRVLFGAAGSGKTVLLKVAIGLEKPTAGKVFLFNQDITKLTERELFAIRSKVGILFQESALFDSLSIEENVAYPILNRAGKPGEETEQDDSVLTRVKEALRFVELEQTLNKFPSELSGGMRRRVGIARAAVTEPPLILYDSPTAGLDPITANNIITLLVKERESRGTTSMIVTHRYQDGHILANYRYNQKEAKLVPAPLRDNVPDTKTTFMVFQEGRLAFSGNEQELDQSKDSYVQKFVKHEPMPSENKPYANGR